MVKLINRFWLTFSTSAIFLFVILISSQTICYSDLGYSASAFQNFFDHHDSIYTTDTYYLSILIGAVWNKLFGWGGIIAFDILTALSFCIIYFLVVKMLQEYQEYKWYILWGFLMSSFYGFFYVFTNVTLTELLLAICCYLVYRYFIDQKLKIIFIASFIGGLMPFARIPNIVLLAVLIIPVAFVWWKRREIKVVFKQLITIVFGITAAVGLVLLVMYLLGHFEYFYQATFKNVVELATAEGESTHSIGMLISQYFKDYMYVGLFAFLSFIVFLSLRFIKNHFHKHSVIFATIIISLYVWTSMFLLRYVYVFGFHYFLYGFSIFILVIAFIKKWELNYYILIWP